MESFISHSFILFRFVCGYSLIELLVGRIRRIIRRIVMFGIRSRRRLRIFKLHWLPALHLHWLCIIFGTQVFVYSPIRVYYKFHSADDCFANFYWVDVLLQEVNHSANKGGERGTYRGKCKLAVLWIELRHLLQSPLSWHNSSLCLYFPNVNHYFYLHQCYIFFIYSSRAPIILPSGICLSPSAQKLSSSSPLPSKSEF